MKFREIGLWAAINRGWNQFGSDLGGDEGLQWSRCSYGLSFLGQRWDISEVASAVSIFFMKVWWEVNGSSLEIALGGIALVQ